MIKYNLNSKIRNTATLLTLLFLCLSVNIYYRLTPAYFPQFKQRAKQIAERIILEEAKKKVELQYPFESPSVKNKLIKKIAKENKLRAKEIAYQEYEKMKDRFQDKTGQTYLLETDPFQWKHYVENILKYDHPGNKRIKNQSYDTYTSPPRGVKLPYYQFFFYLNAFIYKVVTAIFKNLSLNKFAFYIPIFYAVVFLTILYFFCRYHFSNLAAFFSVMFVGLNNIFLIRSSVGWFDYEILSLTFSLIIIWLLIAGLKNKERIKKLLFCSLLASFFVGLYAYTWVGWWFIFLVAEAAVLFGLINSYLINYKEKDKLKKETIGYLIAGGIFLAGSIIFCILIPRMNPFKIVYATIESNLKLGTPLIASIWPNTYYTVGELRSASPQMIANALYGWIPLTFSIVGWALIYIKRRRTEQKDFLNIMFFLMLFTIFTSLRARRFIVFLSLPVGIFFGGFMEEIKEIIRKTLVTNFKRGLLFLSIFLIGIFFAGNIFFTRQFSSASSIYPFMNDDWDRALTYIRENTSEDAIINSWWDFGAMFKDRAKRRVIFDGQSQRTPVAYWMARVLITNDEDKAVRILRMLNNASYTTFDVLNKQIKDLFRSIAVVNELLESNREQGEYILKKEKIPPHITKKVLNDLYKRPPPAYFIVERSMISKIFQISFLGNWDFKKLYVRRNIDKNRKEVIRGLQNIFGLSEKESEAIYQSIAFIPPERAKEALSQRERFYSSLTKGVKKGSIVYFPNSLVFDLNSKTMSYFAKGQGWSGYRIPKRAIIFKDGNFEKINFREKGGNDTVLLIIEGEEYYSVFLDEALTQSLFTRLYFIKKGFKFFEPVYSDEAGGIYVYRIKWEAAGE